MIQLIKIITSLFLLVIAGSSSGQFLSNPSFEGIPAPATAPPGWAICTPVWSTPDIQPGNFNVYLPPSHGNTYLGMTARPDFTWEDVHASFLKPLKVDSCYTFKIDLAFQEDVATYVMQPLVLKIYGTNFTCGKTNLLWQSPAIANEEWMTYQFNIIPDQYNITDLVLEAYYLGTNPYWGYVLMDNIRIYQAPPLNLGNDTTITLCDLEYFTLNAGGGFASYLWSDGTADSTLNINSSGYYWVHVISEQGCEDSDTIYVEIIDYEPMTTNMIDSMYICEGQQIQVTVEVEFGAEPYSYNWLGLGDTLQSALLEPDTTSWFYAQVVDKCLDTITDSVKIIVLETPNINLGGSIVICGGQDTTLNAGSGYLGYLWSNGSNDSTITVSQEGWYWVKVVGFGGCLATDSVYVSFYPEIHTSLPSDTAMCKNGSIVLDPGGGFVSYLWIGAISSQTLLVSEPGFYWVTVTNDNGCTTTDTVLVTWGPAVNVSLGPDTTICSGNNYLLTPGPEFTNYLWQNGQTTPAIQVTLPGLYWIQVTDIFGCIGTDSVVIGVNPSPTVYLGEDTTICWGQTLILNPAGQYSSYTWQDNSTFPIYTVTSTGYYSVTVTNTFNCPASDEIFVKVSNPSVDLGGDSLLCTGDTLLLDAGTGFTEITWQDGSHQQIYTVVSGGNYSVTVTDSYGCEGNGSIVIQQMETPYADLGPDGTICSGESWILSGPDGDFTYLWNGQSGNQSYTVTKGGTYQVVVTNDCGTASDEVIITEIELPVVSLGEDQVLLPGETIELDAGSGFESYLWQDGSTGQTYLISSGMLAPSDPFYFVQVIQNGCANSDTIQILLFNVWVPLVVTPNGDQKNDLFQPDPERWQAINNHYIEVFNRWGEKVWESDHFEEGWDAKQNGNTVADGTYYWVLDVYYGSQNLKQTLKGSVTILAGGE